MTASLTEKVGELVEELAAGSDGGHVLIRKGRNRDDGKNEWRVNIRVNGREYTNTGRMLDTCLARAATRLEGLARQNFSLTAASALPDSSFAAQKKS